MNTKHMFLVLISLVMVIMVSGFVNAITEVNLNLSDVVSHSRGYSSLTETNRLSGVYYLKNDTYTFNITIYNMNDTRNITNINITLNPGFTFIEGSNVTAPNRSVGNDTYDQFTNASDRILMWSNSYYLINASGGNATSSTGLLNSTWFSFNATIEKGNNSDGGCNFSATAGFGDDGKPHATMVLNFNITVDNTPPGLSSAITNDTTTINVTFVDLSGILGPSVNASDFYIAITNSSGDVINYSVSAITSPLNSSTQTLTVSAAFSKNETPVVYMNGSATSHNVTDYAGNTLLANVSVTATDGTRPSLLSAGLIYNYSSRNLTLIFDEPMNSTVDVATIILAPMYNSKAANEDILTLNDGNTSYTIYAGSTNKTVIQISEAFRDTILGWNPPGEGLNITFDLTAFNDSSGNLVNAVDNQTINLYVNDTIDPYLISAKYTHATRNLNLTFSEAMDGYTMNLTNIYIGNQSNMSNRSLSKFIRLNASLVVVNNGTNSSTISINLTNVRLAANISEWRVDTLCIWYNSYNETAKDLTGRNISSTTTNQSTYGYLNNTDDSPTYTNDSTAPVLLAAIVLTDTSPTRAGTVMFNVTFNEPMDRGTTISVILQTNASSNATVVTDSWFNYTLWNGSYDIPFHWKDTAGDGTVIINVTGAKDLAFNSMTANITNTFVMDTTPPTLDIVWYNDTGYDYNESTGVQNGTDFFILKFSENVTLVSASVNDSSAILIANGTNTSGEFFGGNSTDTNNGATFVRTADYKKVKVSIANNISIWVRGIYNHTGKVQGIIPKNNTGAITDLAGNNLTNSTGIKDIYDNVLTYTADANGIIDWTGFSIPHDFTSTATSDALTGYTGTIYTHNGSAWVLTTTANILPFRAYLIKISGVTINDTFDLPIQTPVSGANPDNTVTTSVYIKDGAWSLVGVDGYLDNTVSDLTAANQWLSGLGVNSAFLGLRDSAATSTILVPGGTALETILPYRAYWLWTPSQTNQPYAFRGYGWLE